MTQTVHRILATLLAVALLAGALAASAEARRAPTTVEGAAIRAAVARFVARPGPPATSAVYRKAFVSTVDPSYALAKLATGDPVLATAVLHRQGGRWRVVSYGAAGFPFAGVPVPVLNDLLGATLCDC